MILMMTAKEIIQYMESLQDDKQRQILMRFFKTRPGEYGEGDEFLGLKVPQTREVVRLRFQEQMSYREISTRLGISEVAVYKHLVQAISRLKERFNP